MSIVTFTMRASLPSVLARSWLRFPVTGLAWLSLLLLIVLSLAPIQPSMRSQAGGQTEHFIAYGLSAMSFVFAYGLLVRRVPVPLLLIALAATLELFQNFSPYRHPRVIDFVAGSAGVLVGAIVACSMLALLQLFLQRFRPNSHPMRRASSRVVKTSGP